MTENWKIKSYSAPGSKYVGPQDVDVYTCPICGWSETVVFIPKECPDCGFKPDEEEE